MTNYPAHWLFSFGGSLLGSQEIWQNNIRFHTPGAGADSFVGEQNALNDFMDDLVVRFGQTVGTGGLGYSSSVFLKWGKFNKIASDGRYESTQETVRRDIAPKGGIGAPASGAPQLALAISFLTDVDRGLASKGRIYVAMPSVVPDASTGAISQVSTASLASNWANLLGEFNNEAGLDVTTMRASVVSGVDTLGRSGAAEAITRVRVGTILDTIRSRRSALPETYASANVP